MYPFLFRLNQPHLVLNSYGALIALAVVVCFIVAPRWAFILEHIDRAVTRRALVTVAVATFFGGHLHFLFNTWQFAIHRARAGYLDTLLWTGIHAGGAIVGLVLSLPLSLRGSGVPLGRFGDALTPTVGLGMSIARIGCFLQGCCYGTPCALPWCLAFPEPSNVWDLHRSVGLVGLDAHYSAPVHPLQLYFAAVGVLIAVGAFGLHPWKRYDGQVALTALVIFSTSSLGLESLRGEFALRAYWQGVPQLTWTALVMTVVSVAALATAEITHHLRVRRHADLVSA